MAGRGNPAIGAIGKDCATASAPEVRMPCRIMNFSN